MTLFFETDYLPSPTFFVLTKTANYQLNQWDAADRVLRADFNGQTVAAIGPGVINRAVEAICLHLPTEAMLDLPIMGNTECKRFTIK